MKYKAGNRRKAAEYEPALVDWWKKNRTFEQSVEQRPIDDSYVFYDGPPFITGMPHHGTLLSSIVKDAVPRFWTMQGKRVERRWGWDCHGLPAENFVEKQLGITDRREIDTDSLSERSATLKSASAQSQGDKPSSFRSSTSPCISSPLTSSEGGVADKAVTKKISLEDYILKARESMVANSETWESTIDRIGRWVDFKGAYRTMDKNFMESVWWAFKTLYEAGKIYEGAKVLMYDTKFATPVSKSEVTMDNDAYQEVTDPSAYVKFKLKKPIKSYLMGVDNIDADLQKLEIKFEKKDSDYLVTLQPEQLEAYERLVEEKLQPEYWNEYVDNGEVVFLFKLPDGKIERHVWAEQNLEDEKRIGELVEQFSVTFSGVKTMLEGNEWYGKGILAPVYLLAWTTTPWTLAGNMALAVNPDLEYGIYNVSDDRIFVVAKSRAEAVQKLLEQEWQELATVKGLDLAGLGYEPLFLGTPEQKLVNWHRFEKQYYPAEEQNAHKIWGAKFVSDADGTGIVHIAPAYGEDDYALGRENRVPCVDVLDEYGCYLPGADEGLKAAGVRPNEEGQIQIWEANKFIAKCLEVAGPIEKIEYIKHEYPFNPRSKQRIMYRAFPSWFFDVQGQKPLMIAQNENINWFPEYLKHGRFEKNIEQAPDWNLSRDRFWATAMPVWKGDKGTVKVVGSYAELKELSGVELEDYHRPWVDQITFDIAGEHFTRIEKVLDCWFESGSMPFAQLHYPFENKEKFERNYPADFIVEYVGQVRAWFYYVHTVNTALAEVGGFGKAAQERAEKNAFKNVITTGTLAGNDGRKMSKSLGNYTDPNVLMDQYSADALRFLLLSSPVLSGEDFALTDKDVSDVQRKLAMIWNVYDFFTTYAEVDNWDSNQAADFQAERLINPLDRWIIARLEQLRQEVTVGMEEYNIPKALSEVLPFVDDLSNWFVRRSRRRFWKSEDDDDKAEAYATLYTVLTRLAMILAPFTPFLAEELYQNLTDSGKSVHLLDWPVAMVLDEEVLAEMARVREVINEGLALRMQKNEHEAQVKVRQPLAKLVYAGEKLPDWGEEIVRDEVNVKSVEQGAETTLDKNITPELAAEGFTRELIRAVQAARKKAGLQVDDRIKLSISCEVPADWVETLQNEVLATSLSQNENYTYDEIAKVSGENVTISLEKA